VANGKKLKDILTQARSSSAYWTELAVLDYTGALWSAMLRRDVSQAELAKRLGKKPAYISRVLNGAPNVTIRTMVEMALALDMRLAIALTEKERAGADFYTSITRNIDKVFVQQENLVLKDRARLDFEAANEAFGVVEAPIRIAAGG
jgi:transcriptional regulator with XRE-family HTH domain